MPLIMRPGLVGRRVGRPGLLGLAARTAVVAGTAGAVNNRMQRRQEERAMEAAPMQEAPPDGGADHRIEQLQQLAQLRAQGVLTDAEFAQQKAQILGA